jgi:PAS domain S-box-containing protein
MPIAESVTHRTIVAFVATVAAYAAAALIGLQWSVIPGAGSAVWPAAGVAFAALMIGGVHLWPAVAIGRLLAAIIAGTPQPLWADILIALATTAGAVAPAVLIRRSGGLDRRLGRMRDMLWLTAGGALAGAIISSTLGMLVLLLGGLEARAAPRLWSTWFAGYLVGVLIVAPAILSWWQRSAWRMPLRVWLHFDLCLAATAVIAYLAFFEPTGRFLPAWYIYPSLVWAALAFQVRGAAVALLVVSVLALASAIAGTGVLSAYATSLPERLFFAQQFVAITALTILFLAAASDERIATSRLRESERRFRLMADSSPALIWVTDADGRMTFVNRRYEEVFGIAPEVLEGDDWLRIVHPGDAASFASDFSAALAERRRFERDVRVLDRGGALRWLHCEGMPRYTGDKFVGYTGVNIDVTTAKLAEQALRESEATMHLALETGKLSPWRWDMRNGEFIAGGGSSDIFGNAPGAATSAGDVLDRVHPDDLDRTRRATDQGIESRRSFDLEYRIKGASGAYEWLSTHIQPIFDEDGLTYLIGVSQIVTDRKRAELHRQLLVNELNHRVKNTLAIVQGIAQQSFKDDRVPAELRRAFEGRLAALAAAHNLLTRENWEAAPLRRIVEDAVRPFGLERFAIDGPELRLAPKPAVSIALALHELATNAAKYGALSSDAGRVTVGWHVDNGAGDATFALLWQERDGPPVAPPKRRGFGSRLIERGLAAELEGEARVDYEPQGVRCSILAPLGRLQT